MADPAPPDDSLEKTAPNADAGSSRLLEGQLIRQRYKIISLIGQGGMGVVYRVEDLLLKKCFALKTLNTSGVTDVEWQRFQKEGRTAGKLDHTGLVKVYDIGITEDNQPFLVMDLVEGTTLDKKIKTSGPLKLAEALPVFIQVCFAMGHAHTQGVVHRDIKPSNIMLTDSTDGPQAKIVDFGIAKLTAKEGETVALTRTGEIFGTPFYMSPEQCLGSGIDHRSDIYSLGCVMFEALTGTPPFMGETALSTLMKHQSEIAPTLKEASLGTEFPQSIERLVARMMEKNPDVRYQQLSQVAQLLNQIKLGEHVEISEKMKSALKSAQSEVAFGLLKPKTALTLVLAFALGFLVRGFCGTTSSAPTRSIVDATPKPVVTESQGYYSQIEGNLRRFDFPEEQPIGQIRATTGFLHLVPKDGKLHTSISAEKVVNLQPFIPFDLNIDGYVLEQSPHILKHFRPDEIRMLSLHRAISNSSLQYLSGLKSVKKLELAYAELPDADLKYVDQLPNLTGLNVSGSEFSGTAVARVQRLNRLKELSVSEITNGIHQLLNQLEGQTELGGLSVRQCKLTDRDLESIVKIPNLHYLDLTDNPGITDRGVSLLPSLSQLNEVRLEGCTVTPHSIPALQAIKHLVGLALDFHKWSPDHQTRLQQATKRAWPVRLETKGAKLPPGSEDSELYLKSPSPSSKL